MHGSEYREKTCWPGKTARAVSIIHHPDIRRTLLTMKAYVDGMRSLLYFVGFCQDKIKTADNSEEKEKYQAFIELLTPIAKGYVTDKAFEVCNHGLQVFGGYGYIREYPMEQLVRDCRITMIYEGTNGIQAMDLLGRKIGLNNGEPLMALFSEIKGVIADAKSIDNLKKMAEKVEETLGKLITATLHISKVATSPEVAKAFASAYPFMDVFGDMMMAWMLLWRAFIASEKLSSGTNGKEEEFYLGQIKTAAFFIHNLLPVTLGKMDVIMATNGAAIEISDAGLGG